MTQQNRVVMVPTEEVDPAPSKFRDLPCGSFFTWREGDTTLQKVHLGPLEDRLAGSSHQGSHALTPDTGEVMIVTDAGLDGPIVWLGTRIETTCPRER
jgi:hypothetical protein